MLVAGLLLLGGRAAANVSPEADIYQALMKKHGVKGPVTYDELRRSAAEFAGRVVEVRGTVVGTAQSGPNMTFILSLGDNASVTIMATRPEIPGVESGNAVRVLARVPEGAVCLTSLDLVGVVPEWAIAPRDPKPKPAQAATAPAPVKEVEAASSDRKSTRLNSSHRT